MVLLMRNSYSFNIVPLLVVLAFSVFVVVGLFVFCLVFSSLIIMWLGMDFTGLTCFEVCWTPWVYRFMPFTKFGKFSVMIQIFFPAHSSSFLLGVWGNKMSDLLVLSHRSLKLSAHYFIQLFSLLFSLDKLLLISKFMDYLSSPLCYCTCPMSFLLLYFSVQNFHLVFLFLFLYWDHLPFHSFQESSPLTVVVYL